MMIDSNNIKYINFLTSSSLGNVRSGFIIFLNSIRKSSNFLSYIDNLKSKNKVNPGIYEKKQLTIFPEKNIRNNNLREVLEKRLNIDYKEYEKIKNYSIKSTLRNISATANLNLDNKYVYVYAPNYFSSLSEAQLNGQNYKYLIGIKHLVGDPIFPPKILEREMYLIEKDYSSWFIDYSHFTEFAARKLSSKLSEDILEVINK